MYTIDAFEQSCSKSELDIFTETPLQVDIEASHYITINPVHPATEINTPLEFAVSGSPELFTDPSNIFLYVKIKLQHEDGTTPASGVVCFPESNILHSLFSQVDFYINDSNVASSSLYYPYRSYLETLLNYSKECKQSILHTTGFYAHPEKDTIIKRFTDSTDKIADYYGRLHTDIGFQPKLLPNNVELRFKLTRSGSAFCVKQSPGATLTASPLQALILDSKLIVRRVKLSPPTFMDLERKIQNMNAKYPIRRTEIKMHTITQGVLQASLANVFTGHIPSRMVIGLLEHSTMSGDYHKSAFEFKPFNLVGLSVLLDGSVLGDGYRTHFSDVNSKISLCARQYYNLYQNSIGMSASSIGVTFDEFVTNSCLFPFDLTRDESASCGLHLNPNINANLSVNLSFGRSVQQTLTCLIFCEFNSTIEITATRAVLTDF